MENFILQGDYSEKNEWVGKECCNCNCIAALSVKDMTKHPVEQVQSEALRDKKSTGWYQKEGSWKTASHT